MKRSFLRSSSDPAKDPRRADDFRLMDLIRQGAAAAFAELVGRHQNRLYRFFRLLGEDRGLAEDLVQEVFLRVFLSRERYRPLVSFSAYLFSIARNVWRDRLRRQRRSPRLALNDRRALEQTVDGAKFLSGVEENLAARLDVREALVELPDPQRLTLILSVYQGLSYAEIAAVLEIPVGTVKSRMFHALRRLKVKLKSHV
ncbi:MAG: RNA polymerase sigma factor [Planctomycetes bacterium]|nr:RNA polymerase sigma factor [Planctomycetota bacterium]